MVGVFSGIVSEEYIRHECLGNFAKITSPVQRRYIEAAMSGDLRKEELHQSLRKLTQFIRATTGLPVIVLLDEYDKPVTAASIEVHSHKPYADEVCVSTIAYYFCY